MKGVYGELIILDGMFLVRRVRLFSIYFFFRLKLICFLDDSLESFFFLGVFLIIFFFMFFRFYIYFIIGYSIVLILIFYLVVYFFGF